MRKKLKKLKKTDSIRSTGLGACRFNLPATFYPLFIFYLLPATNPRVSAEPVHTLYLHVPLPMQTFPVVVDGDLDMTTLLDSISVYIRPTVRKRENEKRNDRRKESVHNYFP